MSRRDLYAHQEQGSGEREGITSLRSPPVMKSQEIVTRSASVRRAMAAREGLVTRAHRRILEEASGRTGAL